MDITAAITRYLTLKAQEKSLKAELDELGDVIRAAIPQGAMLTTEAGSAHLQEKFPRTYKVTGVGGIMALFDKHPELDRARFLTVKSAEVQKLPEELQAGLSFTVKPTTALIVK